MTKFIISLGLFFSLLQASTAVAQIPSDVEALIEAKITAQNQCFEQRYDVVKPACESRQVLREKIEQAGWCYRWPMKGEKKGSHVSCSETAFENVYIAIPKDSGKPILTDHFAKWNMELYDKGMTGVNPVQNTPIGKLSFSCKKNSDPKAVVLLNDSSFGFTGEAFEAELYIGFKYCVVDAEISRPGSGFTKIVFGKENTREILRWVDDSTDGAYGFDFKARETRTDRQVHFMLHNLTTKNRYAADVKGLLARTAAMRNRCGA